MNVSPGGGVLPYKGLMGTCGQPGYVFREFCLEQGIEFIIFCLNQGIDLSIFFLNWVKCLKRGIKNRNSVLKWVGKSAIFVLNRVRVWGAAPHLPNQGYIEYPPGMFPLRGHIFRNNNSNWNLAFFQGMFSDSEGTFRERKFSDTRRFIYHMLETETTEGWKNIV